MYKKAFIVLLALISLTGQAEERKVISQTDGSITFVVDEGLEPITERYKYLFDGEQTAKAILNEDKTILNKAYNIVATSFADAKNLKDAHKDAFFQSVVRAYKMHKSLTLSPDMIWLLISQGFARYVNAHSEELRPQLVSHTGKMDLAIETELDLFSGQADYTKLVGDFASEIEKYTKDDIAKTLTADFSTTTLTERVASQITLMESVKSYFEYLVMYAACGIPTITLKGTAADWQRVLDKTRKLSQYGLADWIKSLEPILTQFVLAAEGQPNQPFWQSIVMKGPIDRLKGGGCSNEKPTFLNGWFLKLFPNENGQTLDSVFHEKEMPSERVCVGFKYRKFDPDKGIVISETPMELIAGFIGAEEDTLTNTITPQIGWIMRQAETDDELFADLQKKSDKDLNLKVTEVPEMLAKLQHIRNLQLKFTDDIVLPEWFDQIEIDNLIIWGKLTKIGDLPQVLDKIKQIYYLEIYLNQDLNYSTIYIRSENRNKEALPEVQAKPHHIKSLNLDFREKAQLPEWLNDLNFDHLTIEGKMTKAEKRSLSKSLKKANVKKFEIMLRE
jgi:hypothetical protein